MAVRWTLSWILLITLYLTTPTLLYEIHGVNLARRLIDISKDGLGQQKIQELFDREANFDIRLPLGDEIAKTLALSLGNRFNLYNQAVKALQQSLVDTYTSFNGVNQTVLGECCKLVTDNLPYSNNLKAKVDTTKPCFRRVGTAEQKPLSVPRQFTELLKDNYKANPNIGWQYFGTEEGIFFSFPARKTQDCVTYDNRLRPWYAEANAPVPKDIVIAFESTRGENAQLITQAVELLLNTTNPNDRITVIKYSHGSPRLYLGSSSQSPCYSQNLALATPQNRNAFLEFVYSKDSASSGNVVNYLSAIDKAFDFFKKAADSTNRNKLLVFLAASNPNDVRTATEVTTRVARRNGALDQPVVIQTYAFGSAMSDNTRNILRAMAEGTTFKTPDGNTKKGIYTPIDDGNQLIGQLQSYYTIFADSATVTTPILPVPYVDFLGLGLVLSLCLPVHVTGVLQGVACIDAKIEDIFFNVTYYHQGIDTYVFIIDSRGRTIQHPMLPKPIDIQEDPIFVDITTLERREEVMEVVDSMKSGGNGSKTFYTTRLSHDQGLYADGAAYQTVVSHYFWAKVPHTDFSLCAVFTDKDGLVDMALRQGVRPSVNYIHPNQLVTGEQQTCQHGATAATTDGSIVSFSGAAYRILTDGVDPNDRTQRIAYDNFFTADASDQGKAFKPSTSPWVTLTGMVDDIWRDDTSSRYNSVILWRHLVTATGVIRIYPGTVFKEYDPDVLSWYKMATLNLGWLMVRQVEGDNFNLMISQSIFKGSRDGQHASTDVPVAVVGGEIRTTFVYNMLKELYPACNDARCFVIDENGFVLAHERYGKKEQKASHLITMEPDIAQYLRNSEQLIRTSCLDFKKYITLFSWTMSLNSWVVTSDSPRFELHTVFGTNVYVGITWEVDRTRTICNCVNVTECKQNTKDDPCQCPCFQTLKFNFCNNTLPSSGSNDAPTCSIQRQEFDIIQPPPQNINLTALTACFVAECRATTVRSMCLENSGCQWCLVDGEKTPGCYNDKVSCTPYSAVSSMCTGVTLRSHCLDRSGCQWCRIDGDNAEGCHSEDKTCGSSITPIVVPIVLILLLIIVLITILCCLRRCYPDKYDKCCSILPCAKQGPETDRPYKGDISPSIVNLPRAPERPPPDRNGNSYIEYHGQDGPQTRAPTPPSMAGRARINSAFRQDDQSIYYEVSPEEAVVRGYTPGSQRGGTFPEVTRTGGSDPGWNRANTLSGGRPPSEQYLHPQNISEPSTAQNSLSHSSGAYIPPSGQSSDFENDHGKIHMDSGSYRPNQAVTYNALQQNAAGGNMALGPMEGNRNSPYQHYQQEQPPPPQPSQLGRKSTVPPIPNFPKGHPYHKQPSSGPSSTENSGGANRYSPRGVPSATPPASYQSEPYDLSHSSHKSQNSNRSAGHPHSQPIVNHNQAIDLSKGPPQRAQSQPAYDSEPVSNQYYGGQQSLPAVSTQPRRNSPLGNENPSRYPQNNVYVNNEAEGRFEDFKDLDLSLEDLRQDHADRQMPLNNNNNNHFGAHGGHPTPPVVVDPYMFVAVNRAELEPVNPPIYMHPLSTDSGMESEQGKQGSSQTFAKYV